MSDKAPDPKGSRPSGNWNEVWDPEHYGTGYGEVLYRRAIGEMPEMESSKAAARRLKGLIRENDRVLDVGCGAGHYLKSIRSAVDVEFSYTGADATQVMLEFARKAFEGEPKTEFVKGDVYDLPFEDNEFDVVISNNLLLHLPSIPGPISELYRVARRHVLIRTLVGKRAFNIKEVFEPEEYESDGTPKHANFFNIYSEKYVTGIIEGLPGVANFSIEPDLDFSSDAIQRDDESLKDPAYYRTTMQGGMQVNEYILSPWHFISIAKSG